jgi:hypothetical protein
MASDYFSLTRLDHALLLRLRSDDGTNRLTRACIQALTETISMPATEQ